MCTCNSFKTQACISVSMFYLQWRNDYKTYVDYAETAANHYGNGPIFGQVWTISAPILIIISELVASTMRPKILKSFQNFMKEVFINIQNSLSSFVWY